MPFTQDNFRQGFLVDEELMAGISDHPEKPGQFLAYVLRHTTGEYLGYCGFETLDLALDAINQIPRAWKYEKSGGCGGGNCEGGQCAKGGCGQGKSACCSANGPKP